MIMMKMKLIFLIYHHVKCCLFLTASVLDCWVVSCFHVNLLISIWVFHEMLVCFRVQVYIYIYIYSFIAWCQQRCNAFVGFTEIQLQALLLFSNQQHKVSGVDVGIGQVSCCIFPIVKTQKLYGSGAGMVNNKISAGQNNIEIGWIKGLLSVLMYG